MALYAVCRPPLLIMMHERGCSRRGVNARGGGVLVIVWSASTYFVSGPSAASPLCVAPVRPGPAIRGFKCFEALSSSMSSIIPRYWLSDAPNDTTYIHKGQNMGNASGFLLQYLSEIHLHGLGLATEFGSLSVSSPVRFPGISSDVHMSDHLGFISPCRHHICKTTVFSARTVQWRERQGAQ
ncbi:hypothetical protein EDB89DRAFT_1976947 [Lactarius sanguifluus]|nr:hypothetical protein EDB89DRAFT_1976947 [Lactarius sanguifluus]